MSHLSLGTGLWLSLCVTARGPQCCSSGVPAGRKSWSQLLGFFYKDLERKDESAACWEPPGNIGMIQQFLQVLMSTKNNPADLSQQAGLSRGAELG